LLLTNITLWPEMAIFHSKSDPRVTEEWQDNILTVGASYVRPVGVEHNIINNNDGPYSFIEVELK